ncbi:MAG: ATP-binding protein [Calditrichia bacterium]
MKNKQKNSVKLLYHSISFKLFMMLLIIAILIIGFYRTMCSNLQTQISEDLIGLSAYRASDIIKTSLHRLMLKNQREELYQTILSIGREPGVEGIRIYNKKGEIKFSTQAEETGKTVDMKAEACYVCHAANQPIESLPIDQKRRIYYTADNRRVMGLINPIRNSPECSDGGCHAHHPDQSILGVLDVRMSLDDLDQAISQVRVKVIGLTVLIIFVSSLLFAIVVYFIIYRPIQTLRDGTLRLASGNLDYRLKADRRDELGQLARSFNYMAESLEKAYDDLKDWSNKLEARVKQKSEELERIHHGMVQVEKMASLGKMAATVAHELNNPIAGIVTYSKLLQKKIKRILPDEADNERILKDLELIHTESLRCGNIVSNLLAFARGKAKKLQECSVESILERALGVVRHHLELGEIEVISAVEVEPSKIECDFDQLVQALVAILVNAVEAMPHGGRIELRVQNSPKSPNHLLIQVSDNGPGIPEDVKDKIFEPFYSTKEDKKGVGLGLAVVYGIVQRHKGQIWVESQEGEGTTFFIELPFKQPEVNAQH